MAIRTSSSSNPVGKIISPIVLSDDDEDDALDFFTMKPSYKKLAVQVRPEDLEQSSSGPSDSSDGEGGVKKKRKRKNPKKSSRALGGKTLSSEKRAFGRGSTEERKSKDRSEVLYISSSDEGRRKDKGKGKEKEKRSRIAITPPPAISAEVRAGIHRVLELHTAPVVRIDDDDDLPSGGYMASSSPVRNTTSMEKMKVHVKMVTDHATLPAGASENAIKQWEKRRTVTVFKDDPLDNLWETIAERVNRTVEEIVLVYDGRRIISKRSTPRQLGMDDGAEIAGYEKAHWERLEKEKQEERKRLIYSTPPPEIDESPMKPVEPEVKKRRIRLRGTWGEHRVGVAPFVKAETLVEVYCVKCGKDKSLAKGLKLVFDGERVDDEMTLADMDVEDGDMIDVEEV